jgi:NADH-quinone oxidoreductase subunit L
MTFALLAIPSVLLLAAILNGACALAGVRGRAVSRRAVHLVGCGAPLIAFLAAFGLWRGLPGAGGRVAVRAFDWMVVGGMDVGVGLAADSLTAVMLLVITGIGGLIHVYSTAYMREEAGYARYFAFLNLFTFFMTILVLGSNLPVLFVGWEGVGLCSYLLIGYWWEDAAKAAAGMKAFVVNRIGDAGFILGMLWLGKTAGTFEFAGIVEFAGTEAGRAALLGPAGVMGASVATMIGLLLFLGATGKSAQVPLYVWLPDAMAGPTPVSALIHAATMVTAGVYLVARLNALYVLAPVAQGVIMVVAGGTALLAGLMAVTQTDIKKVLAYSTISQIGYMMMGVATGHVAAGMFHVVTHAFFKASLFLGAGSVIHACHHEQDLRRMGGLARRMPWTCAAMTISAAAMAGVPPLSGFFSKDEILWRTFTAGTVAGRVGWALGMVGALLTAFYMFRLILLAFAGSYRGHAHPHEVPLAMRVPQGLLAAGAALIGFLGVPHVLGGHNRFEHHLEAGIPEWARAPEAASLPPPAVEISLMAWSVVLGLLGLAAAWWAYVWRPGLPERMAAAFPRGYRLIHDRFRVDEAYAAGVVRPLEKAAESIVLRGVDQGLIEGVVNGLGRLASAIGRLLSIGQSGLIRGYIAIMIVGAVVIVLTVLG